MQIIEEEGLLSRYGRALLCGVVLLVLAPLVAACTGGPTSSVAQAVTTTPTPPPATPAARATTSAEGTPTARPIPTGTPPNPMDVLHMLKFVDATLTLVKRDAVSLDKSGIDSVLATISNAASAPITREVASTIAVLQYDTTYREWNPIWYSDLISGTASPLPAANRAGGTNGADLLGTGSPVLALRTTTRNGQAHLALWRWDAGKHTAEPVKLLAGGQERTLFDADLDLNLADLDNDGVYEVVGDNVKDVQVWKWDGQKFVPRNEGGR